MKIRDHKGLPIQAVFEFDHAGSKVSITTLGRFPEVAVFLPDGANRGPFHSIAEAMQFAEFMRMQSIAFHS